MKTETPQMDWQQVALNGGPPCFHVEGPQYCGRAERWEGHGNEAFHNYVSLDDLLNAERERCAKIADKEADDWVVASRNYKALDPMKNTCLSRSEMATEIAAAIRGKQ